MFPKLKTLMRTRYIQVLHPLGFYHRAALLMIFSLYVSHDTSASMLCNSNHAPVVSCYRKHHQVTCLKEHIHAGYDGMHVPTGYMNFHLPDMSAHPSLRKRHGADVLAMLCGFERPWAFLATGHQETRFSKQHP